MGLESAIAQFVYGREDHSDLKPNARLCRGNLHRAALAHEAVEMLVQRDGLWALAGKKFPDRIRSAGVRHIRIDELAVTPGTSPQRA